MTMQGQLEESRAHASRTLRDKEDLAKKVEALEGAADVSQVPSASLL